MIGQLAVKIAGRDSGRQCVIVSKIDSNYFLIDGNVRRKKCNISHLELLNKKINIKEGASTLEIHKAMEKEGLKVIKIKPRKEIKSRPKKVRKTNVNKEEIKELKPKKEKKNVSKGTKE